MVEVYEQGPTIVLRSDAVGTVYLDNAGNVVDERDLSRLTRLAQIPSR